MGIEVALTVGWFLILISVWLQLVQLAIFLGKWGSLGQ